MFSQNDGNFTVTAYALTIEAPSTDLATVYTVLNRGKAVTLHLGQPFQVHTFDQQLYALAQQVKWARSLEFPNLTIRLGGFHTVCTFIACIGRIWGDSGLKDMMPSLMAEPGIYATNTTDRMLGDICFIEECKALLSAMRF